MLRHIPPGIRDTLVIVIPFFTPAVILLSLGYLYWPVYLSLAGLTALLLLFAGRGIWAISGRPRLRNTLQGVWTSCVTLAIIFFLLEAVFRLFVARSDALAITLSHRNWMWRYWHPINSLGYRDDERTPEMVAGRTKVLIVGDSFPSGFGIEDYHYTMGNVLQTELGHPYVVMLAAKPGWDSGMEYQALIAYPYTPDIVILIYYINDNEQVAAKHGMWPENPVPAAHSPLFPLIGSSYLLNFVYFQGLRLPVMQADNTYLSFMQTAYKMPEIWSEHQAQLLAFSDWTKLHHVPLIVVIFPNLVDPASTKFATDKVAATFSSVDATVIDMTPDLIGEDPKDNVVSPVDPHPNIALHHRVADDMCRAIAALPDLPPVSCPPAP